MYFLFVKAYIMFIFMKVIQVIFLSKFIWLDQFWTMIWIGFLRGMIGLISVSKVILVTRTENMVIFFS